LSLKDLADAISGDFGRNRCENRLKSPQNIPDKGFSLLSIIKERDCFFSMMRSGRASQRESGGLGDGFPFRE
jgi:hypothetical protein